MSKSNLVIEKDDQGVVSLILNRPEVNNALDEALISALDQALQTLESDNVRVLQLRANGKHFSAGADIDWMQKAQTLTRKDNDKDALKLATLLKRLSQFPAPVISVVQGAAYGGALGLMAASDIVIAGDNSRFCFSEVKLGLIPSVISPYVVSAIGVRQTRRYFLTAEVFDAPQALSLGLVHDVCETSALKRQVEGVVAHLLKGGPVAHKKTKQLLRDIENQSFSDELMVLTAKRIADIRITEEAKEGLGAFFDKRKPTWEVS